MDILFLVVVTSTTAIVSLIGGILLLIGSKKHAKFIEKFGTWFSVAVLLAIVIFDLIPEIFEDELFETWQSILFIIFGFLFCIFISMLMGRFHKHGDEHAFHNKKQAYAMLVVDSLHAVVDGLVIGASFNISMKAGAFALIATTVHEIPQEIGDFSLMIRSKLPAKRILRLQILSSLVLVPSTLLAYKAGNIFEDYLSIALALIAGFFLYIAFGEIWSIIKR